MTACVLDASVAAKWFLPPQNETLVEQAVEVLQRQESGNLTLAVPDLFWSEIGNILWKAVRIRTLSKAEAHAALSAIDDLDLSTYPSKPFQKEALDIATSYDRTFYDATYLALSAKTKMPLLSADQRLVNAVAAYFPVISLAAFSFTV